MIRALALAALIRFQVWYGTRCPEHHAPTEWDDDYGKMRCSITKQPVSTERR